MFFQKMNPQEVSIKFLEYLIVMKLAIRVGSTVDLQDRQSQYCHKNPQLYNHRWMLYADTPNMKRQETSLLQKCQEFGACPENAQYVSNSKEGQGYVYVIL